MFLQSEADGRKRSRQVPISFSTSTHRTTAYPTGRTRSLSSWSFVQVCALARNVAGVAGSLTPGGGIIDLLNKRLRDRLKEIEILNIFADVCEAVAAMHAMGRPLLHRDLKVRGPARPN